MLLPFHERSEIKSVVAPSSINLTLVVACQKT